MQLIVSILVDYVPYCNVAQVYRFIRKVARLQAEDIRFNFIVTALRVTHLTRAFNAVSWINGDY